MGNTCTVCILSILRGQQGVRVSCHPGRESQPDMAVTRPQAPRGLQGWEFLVA